MNKIKIEKIELEGCTCGICVAYPCKYDKFGKWVGSGELKMWDCSKCPILDKT